MRNYIIIKIVVEGLHYWEECNIDNVSYLRNLHRHLFHIRCEKEVSGLNREIEIISFKKKVEEYLHKCFYNDVYKCLNFKDLSCEMIAQLLFEAFELNMCSVLEDNENGAKIVK